MGISIGNLAYSIIEILINVELLEKSTSLQNFIMRFEIVGKFWTNIFLRLEI